MASEETKQLGRALCEKLGSDDWCTAQGGFFVKSHGFISTSKARTVTGIVATPRVKKTIATNGRGGEWNAFVALTMAVSRAKKAGI